jgi:hypothetical protein
LSSFKIQLSNFEPLFVVIMPKFIVNLDHIFFIFTCSILLVFFDQLTSDFIEESVLFFVFLIEILHLLGWYYLTKFTDIFAQVYELRGTLIALTSSLNTSMW